eukprot:1158531-Pelagomonas_calceolata.AAC.8
MLITSVIQNVAISVALHVRADAGPLEAPALARQARLSTHLPVRCHNLLAVHSLLHQFKHQIRSCGPGLIRSSLGFKGLRALMSSSKKPFARSLHSRSGTSKAWLQTGNTHYEELIPQIICRFIL